jgi:hypothetical protein
MRKGYQAILLAISTAITAQTGVRPNAQIWAPPFVQLPPEWPHSTIQKPIITRITVADFPIQLEDTELDVVAKHLNVTTGHQGDASEFLAWLCLHGKDKEGPWGLWLTSGEIDGPMIEGFQLQRLTTSAALDSRCRSLNDSSRSISLPIPIHLGMTESQVQAVLGKPSSRFGDASIYVHEHGLQLHGEPYTAGNSVILSYKNGELWRIVVHYTISS